MYQKINLIGRLTKDVELKTVNVNNESRSVANFSVATDDRGNTDYFDIVAWNKLAENAANYLGKGRLVMIEGKMKRRSYDNQAGAKVYVWELIAEEIKFLDSKANSNGGQTTQAQQPVQQTPYQQPQQPQYQQPVQPQYQPTQNPTGFPQNGGGNDFPF